MTNNWDKFVLLMWKNWRLQWKHKIQLIVELLLPVIFATLLIIVRDLVSPESYQEPTKFQPVKVQFSVSEKILLQQSIKRWEIAYYPNGQCLSEVGILVENWLNTNNNITEDKVDFKVIGYNSLAELATQVQHNGIVAAVQFDKTFLNAVECPKKISYSIKFPSELREKDNMFGSTYNWQTNNLYPLVDFGGLRIGEYINVDAFPSYYDEGFIGIQHAFAMAFIEKHKKSTENLPQINIQRFPYPPYIFDPLLKGLESFVSIIILLSFVYPCSQTVKYVTTEKEKQLKEVMKIMGLPNWLHWTAWFVKTYSMTIITTSLIVIIFKVNWSDPEVSVLSHCDWSILLVFFYIYCISVVTFCFMVATFFTKANTAAAVTGLLWFIIYLPYQFTQNTYSSLSLNEKLGLSVLSNTAMGFGFKIILKLEGTGEGLQWSNMFRPVNSDDNISIGHIMGMLIVDSIIYMLIALYVEKILPGSYGIPEKWYFPFTKKFYCSSSINNDNNSEMNGHTTRSDPAAFEREPKNKNIGLSIKGFGKKFGDKSAVNDLSINLYEDEITVLLGHNGAGKTTTISMLTGMIPPSYGTATINGYDIRSDLMNARMSLGLCPQHNILFDDLTVREHIEFFSRLKGFVKHEVELEVQKYVKLLELEDKINVESKNLSGGMKRKLSVAAALCGGSKVVLCDEPTSGMDPSARRALWDLLEMESKGRTILLSTHFMDEADVLGDRIAIMCNGHLKAYGTSFFLKKRYGAGYHLICVKSSGCQPAEITKTLRQFIPDIVVESEFGSELSYRLQDKYSHRFEEMLLELENKSSDLKLNGFGISHTTLEEVFMMVGSDREESISENNTRIAENGNSHNTENGKKKIENTKSSDYGNDSYSIGDENNQFLSGIQLTVSQWKAMLLKKYLHAIRNYILLGIQNFMPIFFVAVTVLIFKAIDPFKTLQPLQLNVGKYADTVTVLSTKDLSKSIIENEIANEYGKYIQSFGKHHKFVATKDDFEDYIIKLGKKDLINVNKKYIIASSIKDDNITAWFNAQLLHVLPVTLNTIHNAILRSVTKDSSFSIEVKNHPYPYDDKTKLKSDNLINFGFQLAMNLSFCMSFVSTFYILFQIKERVSRAKLLQFVSGVRVFTFWITQFMFDYGTYVITAIFTVITIACFQQESFSTADELGRTFLVLILFGISSLPITYLWGFLFSESATGFSRVSIFNVFTGMALSILIFFLQLFVDKDITSIVNSVCLIFPHYLLAKSLGNISRISKTTSSCLKICEILTIDKFDCNMDILCRYLPDDCCVPDYFAWEEPGIGSHILYTFIVFFIISSILMIKEYRLLHGIIHHIQQSLFEKFYKPKVDQNQGAQMDDDVKEEKLRIARMSAEDISNTNLVLDRISKYYWKFLAVNDISLAVKHSECFGLLGVNGAGKTTTFKMMTGDERISYGEAYVKGLSIKREMRAVCHEIGYCPQFDALLDDLTGREILRIFALLRGIPPHQINSVCKELAKSFGFTKHIDKPAKTYSGGNKRKLSTSIALIGSPSVIYLDEPTSGMDPGAKRQLWNKVSEIRNTGKSVVLTSHSMEECEALCTRLAIMVNGDFKCIGSTQHLKNKFSKGVVLKIKIFKNEGNEGNVRRSRLSQIRPSVIQRHLSMEDEIAHIIKFIEEKFEYAELKEQHQGLLTFYIPLTSIRWSKIFGLMEAHREELKIEDYSISQTSLEEIFLEFAKHQKHDSRVQQ